LTTKELQKLLGTPVRGKTRAAEELDRRIVTVFFRCGCRASDVHRENEWELVAGPSCTIATHDGVSVEA
jgi:hypothetical protein